MSQRGSSKAWDRSQSSTRSRSSSTKCIPRRGAKRKGGWGLGTGGWKRYFSQPRGRSHEPRRGSMRLKLKIWRQTGPTAAGRLEDYVADPVSPDMSFLEMLDVVNEGLVKGGKDAIAFDSDCREGICGMCSLVVNGVPHGPDRGTTVCQLHMRRFKDGDTGTVEPWGAQAFPVGKDLVGDPSAFQRIHGACGFFPVHR